MKKIIYFGLLIVLLVSQASGCTKNSAIDADIQKLKEITLCESWGFDNGFSSILTPDTSSNYAANYYLPNFYDTLVNYENGKVTPSLAESWSVSEDGLVYTFNLKKGIKFSDGADFNAGVVKRNLEMIPRLLGKYVGSYAYVLSIIEDIKVIDDHQVEVHLVAPYYGTLVDFTKFNPMAMMSPNAFNDDDTLSEKIRTSTMGTGPYKFDVEQSSSNTYSFVHNSYYYGLKPEIERFNIKVIPDDESKSLSLRNGEIDLIFGADKIPYNSFKEFSNDENYGAKISDISIKSRFLAFNSQEEPFNDINIRLAVSHAIDKRGICNNLLYGLEKESAVFFNKNLPYCDVSVKPYEYDLAKAKLLLEKAGWQDTDGDGIREKDGKRLAIELLHISGIGSVDDLALTLVAYLNKIGMEVSITSLDFMSSYGKSQEGSYSLQYKESYGIAYEPFTTIANMNTNTTADNALAQGLAHLPNGNELIMELNSLVKESVIQSRYDYLLTEIHQNISFVPISDMKELIVFNADKISDYSFYGNPSYLNIAGVKLR